MFNDTQTDKIRSLRTNEKWTYLVRFLVRSSRDGQRRPSKILIFLVGPAERTQ